MFVFSVLVLVGLSDAMAETSVDPERGANLYKANCAACHGEALDGKGPAGSALKPAPSNFKDVQFWADRDEKSVKAGIKNGKPGTAMMAFAHLIDEDVESIVAYLMANKP
jgi:high-affinity iron transporter